VYLRREEFRELRATTNDTITLMSLHLSLGDVGWCYILSMTDITTDKDARESNIIVPPNNANPPRISEAKVEFVTGDCIVDQKP
jgi:hypothetical protein